MVSKRMHFYEDLEISKSSRAMVRKHFQSAESKKRPPLQNMFDEVYANNERTWNMVEQEAELNKHIHEHGRHYGKPSEHWLYISLCT